MENKRYHHTNLKDSQISKEIKIIKTWIEDINRFIERYIDRLLFLMDS